MTNTCTWCPKGKLTTINDIRQALAIKHKASIDCPITTGIFVWIDANAAMEQKQQGKTDTTSHWRTLKTGEIINEKYPGGLDGQKLLLEQEGHSVIKKGKNYAVKDYLQALAPLNQ